MRTGLMAAAMNVGLSALLLCAMGLGASAVAAPDGGTLFKQRCAGCHSGPNSPIAPNLSGVVGRKAASTGFRYSPALKASGMTWTRANLDRFLAGPQQMVPGTRMVIQVSNPAERAAIVAYLAGSR